MAAGDGQSTLLGNEELEGALITKSSSGTLECVLGDALSRINEEQRDFRSWLDSNGLERYFDKLVFSGYGLKRLSCCNQTELGAIAEVCEMPTGHARQLRRGALALRESMGQDADRLLGLECDMTKAGSKTDDKCGSPRCGADGELTEETGVCSGTGDSSCLGLLDGGGGPLGTQVVAETLPGESAYDDSPAIAWPKELVEPQTSQVAQIVEPQPSPVSANAEAESPRLKPELATTDKEDTDCDTPRRESSSRRLSRKISLTKESIANSGSWLKSWLPGGDATHASPPNSPKYRSMGRVQVPPIAPEILEARKRVCYTLDNSPLEVGRKAVDRSAYTICKTVDSRERHILMKLADKDPFVKRAIGCLVGLAVGDSLGSFFEFIPVSKKGCKFDPKTLCYTGEFNTFRMKPGQWTDDTSMALCLADSVLVHRTYNGSDVRVRFWNWWNRGYNNAFRLDKTRSKQSVGLGSGIRTALDDVRISNPPPRFEPGGESGGGQHDAGNGSIMRLAPIPLFFFRDVDLAVRVCAESSLTTHPGPHAADACAFLGYILVRALTRPLKARESAARFLDRVAASYMARQEVKFQPMIAKLIASNEPPGSKERCWNWRDSKGPYLEESIAARGEEYNGFPVNEDYMGSYCLDGLAIAMHCFYHTTSYMAAITKCVNLLGDADTNAAICGQIAGCFYGIDAIDCRLVKRLELWDEGDIAFRAVLLFLQGHQITDDQKEKARIRSVGSLACYAHEVPEQLPPAPPEMFWPSIPSAVTSCFVGGDLLQKMGAQRLVLLNGPANQGKPKAASPRERVPLKAAG